MRLVARRVGIALDCGAELLFEQLAGEGPHEPQQAGQALALLRRVDLFRPVEADGEADRSSQDFRIIGERHGHPPRR